MIASAFVLRAGRVLVVTPSRLVREQIAEEIRDLSLLKVLGALPEACGKPNVASVGERITRPEGWEELRCYDVVVGTVQSISPAIENVAAPETDQFDVVIVDEAHHSSARTWQALLDCFEDSRRILFTATPYRRDRREIRGRFVYTYGIREARADGVFGDIRYRAVESRDDALMGDIEVAKKTEEQFREDRRRGFDHVVMVRTDRKTRARELARIYEEQTGLRLVPLNSDHSLRHAKSVIRRLREGELDGVIAVNMLGEGFDLPALKIAAVHAPHKSLAATLQFIGRFARASGENLGPATFLAVPDDIEIERSRLFEAGAVWQDMIENLSETRIEEESGVREALESFESDDALAANLGDLSLYALEPFHHVKIVRVTGSVDLTRDLELPRATTVFRSMSDEYGAAVWITRERVGVRWSSDGHIVDVRHELFVVHYDQAAQLLFICASARTDGVFERIARQLVAGEVRNLSLDRINRALNGLESLEFFNVGMRNRAPGIQTESYRIMAGPRVGQAILPSHGRSFDRGHSYGRGEDEGEAVTIGLSSASKVWSNRTSKIPALIVWCRKLSRRIEAERTPVTGSGLDHLSMGEEVDELPEGIFHADWNSIVYSRQWLAEVDANGHGRSVDLLDFDLAIERERCTQGKIALAFRNGEFVYRATFSVETRPMFEASGQNDFEIDVGSWSGEGTGLIEFLNEHPLHFYTEDMCLLVGSDLSRPPQKPRPFAEEQIEAVPWAANGVDVRVEFGGSGRDGMSVHEFVEKYLSDGQWRVLYYDHGSGEIADFVGFSEVGDRVSVTLFHCKGAGGESPGSRVGDVYEVCGQAVKSVIYADPTLLLERIERRYSSGAGAARFVYGDVNDLKELVGSRGPALFDFEMVVVQPGISRATMSEAMANILAAANDYLVQGGFRSLRIMGS